jgi:hypothetical protein
MWTGEKIWWEGYVVSYLSIFPPAFSSALSSFPASLLLLLSLYIILHPILPPCCLPFTSQDAAEFGRIGKYYAVESMLVWDPVRGVYLEDATPSYGKDTLEAFFTKAIKEGLKWVSELAEVVSCFWSET